MVLTPLPYPQCLDWTRNPPPHLSGYRKFILDHDWASTPLGPIETWNDRLRQNVVMIMASPDPRLILWGNELCLLYNEACLALIGQKHPFALGHGPMHVFSEIWQPLKSIVKRAMHQGVATRVQDLELMIDRDGRFGPEETYWSFTMLPIIGPDGTAVGALDEFVESTATVIGVRRMNTLITLGEKAAAASSIKELWKLVLEGLEPNSQDIPFALLYSINESDEDGQDDLREHSDFAHSSRPKQCVLEGTIGISSNHPAAIPSFPLTEGDHGYALPFRRAWTSAKPSFLQAQNQSLPSPLSDIRAEGRGFNDATTTAIALPIPPLSGASIRGFLLLGLNPRRPYDEDYQVFIRLLNDRLVKAVASIIVPEEQRRNRELMEANNSRHDKFSRELERRRQEAESSEATFTALAESAPIGCAVFQVDGQPRWMNQAYLDLVGLKGDELPTGMWSYTVLDEDREFVENQWRKLATGQTVDPFEFRVKRPFRASQEDDTQVIEYSWILANAFPELDENGTAQKILGWLTDISHQKWSQHLQAQRLEDALETKRQSENFIDMTSHEMRNPLSAILQSADGILGVLRYQRHGTPRTPLFLDTEAQEIIIDSAQTVILCAQHQKRIVDDITLSKLDSNLLVISPDIIQPAALVERAIKMYEAELNSARIRLSLQVHQSYDDLSIDTVLLDPSRVLQVLINLLTNAIKFTRDRKKRVITIFLSASHKKPSSGHDNLAYIPRRANRPDHTFGEEWGPGDDIYLQLAVEDTGRGLSADEMKLLFHRFSQASPKTYGEYGGSGLGLFISRELTELQGGQIGVASKEGRGSTFAFYVKSRRYVAPPSPTPAPIAPIRPSPMHTAPLRRVSMSKLGPISLPTLSSRAGDPMPLTAPTDPSWTVHHPGGPITFRNVSPVTPPLADSRARYHSLKVLIVEDNAINQKVMAQQLRRAGCEVLVASHGGEALAMLGRSTFAAAATPPILTPTSTSALIDSPSALMPPRPPPLEISVLLMDLEMPVMDGLTCVRHIRHMQSTRSLTRHVPVIAVTANARSEQISRAMQAGMDLVVTKPFRILELLPLMDGLVARINGTVGGAPAK
ncbi:histidine kinase [Phyllosticta citriasiana]|uniref:histidine kinase n=1 Tax=Phyllosticta citriasiana TaxID=595635 RepID=UPI0030FD611B